MGLSLGIVLMAFSGAVSAQQQTASQLSLGELARKVRDERARQDLRNVPLYTNDNLPSGSFGLGVIAAASSASTGRAVNPAVVAETDRGRQELAELRYNLSEATQHLQLHEQELTVLEQQLAQNNMQYYSNPNQTLTQEYNRRDINKLISDANEKKAQVGDEQQSVRRLQSQLEAAEGRWGWLLAGRAGKLPAVAEPPIHAVPGTSAYYRAKLEFLHQKLSTAKEEQKLAENQLDLLHVQRIRTLDPNLQAQLSAGISTKQNDLDAARVNVQETERRIANLEETLHRSEGVTQPPAPGSQPAPQQ